MPPSAIASSWVGHPEVSLRHLKHALNDPPFASQTGAASRSHGQVLLQGAAVDPLTLGQLVDQKIDQLAPGERHVVARGVDEPATAGRGGYPGEQLHQQPLLDQGVTHFGRHADDALALECRLHHQGGVIEDEIALQPDAASQVAGQRVKQFAILHPQTDHVVP